jgi:hypothetical protein
MVRLTLSVPVLIALAAIAVGCGGPSRGAAVPADGGGERARDAFARVPLTFVENRGQSDARVRFQAQGPGHAFFLTPRQIALMLQQDSGKGVALSLRFLGADPRVALTGAQRAPGTVNYLRGEDPARWRTGAPGYLDVTYRRLWPGIDLKLSARDGALKYEFHVRPGARPADIRLAYRGAQGLRRDGGGALQIQTALGDLRDAPPVAYQQIGGKRVPVDSRYALSGDRAYGFAVGDYARDRELIIDPSLAYSTLLGGTSHEMGSAIQVDASGNAYVTGFTQSPDFPTTAGAFDRTGSASNNLDAFVSKLNAAGTALVYSTFLGGGNSEWGRDIAIDSAGNAYVTGQTMSPSFPTTGGAFDRTFNIDNCPRCGIDEVDAFVAKLNPSGSGLVYSTFLGGTQPDETFGIALDGARNAYVTGETVSSNFPTTAGAFDATANGGSDAFVTKLNATGSALVYSTRLGGSDNELPEDLAVEPSGNAVVGGSTRSSEFPTTPGAFDTTQNGGAFDERFDLFVTKLNAGGTGLVYSTFVGGSKSDFGDDFALDAAGNAYMVGGTLSPDFPTTPGTFDPAFGGESEGFVFKLNPTGSSLVYSTFLGQAGASAIVPDANGNVWLAGASGPDGAITADAFDRFFNGGNVDAYIFKLSANGSALQFASFLGGSQTETANDVALGPDGDPYLTGHTFSPDFQTTPGAVDRTWGGDPTIFWGEAFVARVDLDGTAPPQVPPAPPPAAPALTGPADAATVAAPVTFDWGDVAGASSYELQVDEISAFGAPLILSATPTASRFTGGSLLDGNWFWRVRAVNSEGAPGAWSAVRTIKVQSTAPPPPPPRPGSPSLTSPAAGAQVTQPFTFDWSDVAAAAWYTIEVDDSSSFAAPLVWAATTTPSQLATNSLPNGTLFWRVRAFNSDGVGGPYSAVRTVQVGATAPPPPGPLAAPSLASPANDARFSPGQQISFDWGDVAGAASYTIQIDDSQSFSAPLTAGDTLVFSQFSTSTLPTTRMWWRVRANDGSGAPGAWSAVRRVEVKR